MEDDIGAMRLLDTLTNEEVKEVCVATIYNIFGFLDLENNNTMSRSDLEKMLKANINNIN